MQALTGPGTFWESQEERARVSASLGRDVNLYGWVFRKGAAIPALKSDLAQALTGTEIAGREVSFCPLPGLCP